MRRAAKQTILKVKPYIPGKPIDEVKRELGLNKVIKLASNENPYGPSPRVIQAIIKEVQHIHRYPDGGCFYLRQELARHLKVKPEELVFGNGSDELIVLAIRAFVKEQDEVIIAKPSFLIYELASKIEGSQIKEIPLKDFRYDLAKMKAAVTPKTRIIFLGNPDNPAGSYLTEHQVRDFLKDLSQDILVFIDEAYYEFVTEKDYVDSIALLKSYPNVIVTRTFSKMYGLAGLRIGYGVAREELIDVLNRIRDPFNVNALAQVAAVACLKDQSYYRKLAKKIQQQREFLYQSFDRLGVECVKSYTNFILINLKTDSRDMAQKLLKKGIIVRDMNGWGLKNFIRVTIGTEIENKKFLKALEELL